jgi:hypothetical protein
MINTGLLPGDDDHLDALELQSDGIIPVAPAVQVSGVLTGMPLLSMALGLPC